MDITDSTTGRAAASDRATYSTRTMSHQRMVHRWRAGRAETVSPEIIGYVHYDGSWWRRTSGMWESIPDGPFAAALAAGHARLVRARRAVGLPPAPRGRDPWTIARMRNRTGGCGKPASFLPMRATDLRPFPPAVCSRSAY